MKKLLVVLTVKDPAHINDIHERLQKLGELSRAEPGCIVYEVSQGVQSPEIFVLNETWETAAAHAVHREAPGFREIYEPLVIPYVDRIAHELAVVE